MDVACCLHKLEDVETLLVESYVSNVVISVQAANVKFTMNVSTLLMTV